MFCVALARALSVAVFACLSLVVAGPVPLACVWKAGIQQVKCVWVGCDFGAGWLIVCFRACAHTLICTRIIAATCVISSVYARCLSHWMV